MERLDTSLDPNLQKILSLGLYLGLRARPRRPRVWPLLSALVILLIASFMLALGPAHIVGPWDVFILLDGAWRILEGQVPHTDFYNPIGALPYWLTAVGMRIGGLSLAGYVYGNLIFLVVGASWGAFIFFRKLPAPCAFLMTLFFSVVIVAPRPLGFDTATTSYAMIYNRYGWTLISIMFIQLFVANRSASYRDGAFDSLSSGLLLGLIFFCKINFFIFAIAAVPLAIWLRPELRGWIALTAVGFVIVCFGAWLAAGVNVLDYVRDVTFAGKSQSISMRQMMLMKTLVTNAAQAFILVGMWFYLIGLPATRREALWRPATQATLTSAFIIAAALIIAVGNAFERSDVPLFLIAGVILLEAWRRQQAMVVEGPKLLRVPAYGLSSLIVVGVFFGGIFEKDVLSLAKSRFVRMPLLSSSQRFDTPRLRNFIIPGTSDYQTTYARARDVPARVNEGLALLRGHLLPQSRLAVLAHTDPFSFALGLTPPRGAPLWWHLGFNFTKANFPMPGHVFSEADFVIYPIVQPEDGSHDTVLALHELYDGHLRQNYWEVGRSAHWVLLKKRVPSARGLAPPAPQFMKA